VESGDAGCRPALPGVRPVAAGAGGWAARIEGFTIAARAATFPVGRSWPQIGVSARAHTA
jgi:hypothetical protein